MTTTHCRIRTTMKLSRSKQRYSKYELPLKKTSKHADLGILLEASSIFAKQPFIREAAECRGPPSSESLQSFKRSKMVVSPEVPCEGLQDSLVTSTRQVNHSSVVGTPRRTGPNVDRRREAFLKVVSPKVQQQYRHHVTAGPSFRTRGICAPHVTPFAAHMRGLPVARSFQGYPNRPMIQPFQHQPRLHRSPQRTIVWDGTRVAKEIGYIRLSENVIRQAVQVLAANERLTITSSPSTAVLDARVDKMLISHAQRRLHVGWRRRTDLPGTNNF